ncbi:MAG: hypothetical protein M5E90_08525 [Asgard group archaeon]|nr:hypothetical protein [Asgard group archaeon]
MMDRLISCGGYLYFLIFDGGGEPTRRRTTNNHDTSRDQTNDHTLIINLDELRHGLWIRYDS